MRVLAPGQKSVAEKFAIAGRDCQHAKARALPRIRSRRYFFFAGAGVAEAPAAGAAVPAGDAAGAAPDPASSILNVQWVSTFFPPDLALTITVQFLSFRRCVTWYATVEFFGSKLASTLPRPLTRISTEP